MNVDYSTRESITVRNPATANLMLDSEDRDHTKFPSPWDFQITERQTTIAGYFTRIGTTEIVLEWCSPNIINDIQGPTGQSAIVLDISGEGANTYDNIATVNLPTGQYTVAQALDVFVSLFNDLSGTTGTTVQFTPGALVGQNGLLTFTGGLVNIVGTALAVRLGFTLAGQDINGYFEEIEIECPDLRPFKFLDFVSYDLTYAQNVKDATTAGGIKDKNVLCRFYMTWEQEPTYDAYGYPILMGYRTFTVRRIFNPPKQIRWDPNLFVGNLRFEVYNSLGEIPVLPDQADWGYFTNWKMTLQLSEN